MSFMRILICILILLISNYSNTESISLLLFMLKKKKKTKPLIIVYFHRAPLKTDIILTPFYRIYCLSAQIEQFIHRKILVVKLDMP